MARRPSMSRRTVLAATTAAFTGCTGGGPDDGADEDPTIEREGPAVGDTVLSHNYPLSLEDVETGEVAAEVHWHGTVGEGDWHYQPLEIPLDAQRTFTVIVRDADQEPLDVGEESAYDVAYSPAEGASDVIDATMAGADLSISGEATGDTAFQLEVHGPDGGSWTAPPLPVTVGAAD